MSGFCFWLACLQKPCTQSALPRLHRWGYTFLDVLTMLRSHSAELRDMGEPPACYFFDAFSINQHTFFLGSTQDQDGHDALIEHLRKR